MHQIFNLNILRSVKWHVGSAHRSALVLIVVWEEKHGMAGLSGDADGLGKDECQARRGM